MSAGEDKDVDVSVSPTVHATSRVLHDLIEERSRQNGIFGLQSHPDGTEDSSQARQRAVAARALCDQALESGRVTWALILQEEVAEALAEVDPERLRAELLQVAAVATQWVDAIDRRTLPPSR